MEYTPTPLVLTKLQIPVCREKLISRSRLLEILNSANSSRLILVCAPAGYGKTTLLVEWAQSLIESDTAIIWYSLDSGDDDLIPFRTYFLASLIQTLGPVPELTQLDQLQRTAPELDMRYFMTTVINAILAIERKCVLILDDYHIISDPAIHDALSYLIAHLPGNLRITIGSRADPPLPLARLRARGQLSEIRTDKLRFKEEESAEFLNENMQLGLSGEGIAALAERTEGWITGLQLAALSLSGRTDKEQVVAAFTGSHRYLVEYLMDEVVHRQSEDVQTFLMSTSILERLSAPLCDNIMGIKESENTGRESGGARPVSLDSQSALEGLERSNLFLVPLDGEQVWFRYHHLFRDFLLSKLAKDQPERIPELHRSACDWLAEHGFLREAASHAFKTNDWEYAAAFVEQHSFTQITYSEMSIIYEWCSAFPEEVMQRHPMLCLHQALSLAYNNRRKNRSRIEARLQQVDQMLAVLEDKQLLQILTELSEVVRTFMGFAPDPHANPRELLARAESMLESYPQGDPGQFSVLLLIGYAQMALQDARSAIKAFESARQIAISERLFFGIVESTFHLARLSHNQGQLHRAEEICRQGLSEIAALLPHPAQELPARGCLYVALGCVLMEQDKLEEAEQHLLHGLELMGGGMNPLYLLTAYVALYRLCEIQDRPAVEGEKYLDRLEAIWPDISFCTEGLRVMHLLRTAADAPGTSEKVENWCRSFSTSISGEALLPGMGPFGAADAFYLARFAWVQAQIALGKSHSTRSYLEQQLDLASAHGLNQRVIELSLLDALAGESEGDHARASAALERGLSLAQPAGYLRIFDRNSTLTKLLTKTAQRGIFKEYIGNILISIGTPKIQDRSRINQAFFGEKLSEREMEVLQLIARGATNQEIAEQLVVTVGTVKSHINHILGKLDSHNRTEAVAKARRLGLLEI